jgi:2-octaprenyl-6-methoxyphenol hydroxylase
VSRDADRAVVEIAGGPRIGCRLVVAAEGRDSPLREQARIPLTRIPYRQTGLVSAIAHERPHHSTALEHFLPAGPFAQLPLSAIEGAPNVSAIVWTEQSATAAKVAAFDDAAYGREIARRLGPHLGAIRPIGRRWSYRLGAMHAHRYFATRLALVGDAAHTIHPIAGQGLNLGFRDIGVLAELVIAALKDGRDPGSVELLAHYQHLRRPANLLMLAATDALDRLFSTDSRLLRAVRDIGIAAVNRSPPLKRLFVRQAMGVGG